MTSAWPTSVGSPVEGPPRWTLTRTVGVSSITPSPRFSIIRLNPGPDVAVIDFTPPHEAPRMAFIDPISSSIWMNVPPTSLNRSATRSATSVAGVIG